MTLGEYLERVNHMEHLVWLAHLDNALEQPDRTDWYLMQIAAEVERLRFPRNAGAVQVKDKLLRFTDGDDEEEAEPKEELSVEEATRRAKATWGMRLAGVRTVKAPPPEER